MLQNKTTQEYMMMTPVRIFKVESEKDYDGYEDYCAFEIQYNRYLPERLAEEKYDGMTSHCEFEDDSYCMKKGKKCEHRRKIGYIKTGTYERVYPAIGEYVVFDNSRNVAFVITEEQLNEKFRKV